MRGARRVRSMKVRKTPVHALACCHLEGARSSLGSASHAEGGSDMRIQYVHGSKFGNGAMVAEEFKKDMETRGVEVDVHHIQDVEPKALPPADLYLFSSPGRMGKPIRGMRRFLKELKLPAGTRYAILTTEIAPQPDKKTGRMPTEEEICRYQRVRPFMNEALESKGLIEVTEDKILVSDIKGPLEEGWQPKVAAFASRILEAEGASSGASLAS